MLNKHSYTQFQRGWNATTDVPFLPMSIPMFQREIPSCVVSKRNSLATYLANYATCLIFALGHFRRTTSLVAVIVPNIGFLVGCRAFLRNPANLN